MRAVLVQGLAWGDEGKGACVDALSRHLPVDQIVRFCGGAQAAHHVVLANGRSHCFSQFGAGMLANSRVRTHLSRFMLVEPFSMMKEADALRELTDNVWERTTVGRDALIITPFHRYLNRLRENSRGKDRHGSCGRGIGVAREMQIFHPTTALYAGDILNQVWTADTLYESVSVMLGEVQELERKLHLEPYFGYIHKQCKELAESYLQWPARIVDGLEPSECMVFEGAQGVLLDEKHGFTPPHVTWTNTTFENADTLLDEVGVKDRLRIGCLRTYYTRHGQGPFPTEDRGLYIPETHNASDGFQGNFRIGHFDYDLVHHAIKIVGGVDLLAVSHFDCLHHFETTEDHFIQSLRDTGLPPIGMTACGSTAEHREIELGVMV